MVAASKAGKPLVSKANGLTGSGKPKEKRRNNEKRKEKSRDAARCRRSRETEIFAELGQVLPLKKEDVNQLDKASIMRIAIAYLKVRDMLQLFPAIQEETRENEVKDDDLLKFANASQLIKQTLDGFLLVLSDDGDITYVSDNISDYLGLAKIDILGQQVWEYLHQCDHAEIKEALSSKRMQTAEKVKSEDGLQTDHRDLFVRFKCTITSRGRSINIKSASYKVIHLTGHLTVNEKGNSVLIVVGRPIPHPSNVEAPLSSTTFMTKHSLNMKFSYVDEKMRETLGYEPEDLMDKSLFEYHHAIDTESLMATFKTVFAKGQGETARYRFLGKFGGYCWVVTQATILYDKMKPQSLVCVNFLISNLENDHETYSLAQYEASRTRIKTEDNNNNKENNNTNNNSNNIINIKPLKKANDVNLPITKIKESQNITAIINDNNNQTAKTATATNTKNNIDNKPTPITPTKAPTTTSTTATLSPIKHSIPPTTTVTSKLLRTNNSSLSVPLSSSPRPKSVTASVFRAAPGLLPNILTKNSNSNNADPNTSTKTNAFKNPLQLPTNVATSTRAQSVTASVFTSLSQVISKPQQQLQLKAYNSSIKTSTAAILAGQHQKKSAESEVENLVEKPPNQQPQQQQDMNKGFLTFVDDASSSELTMLKEEPDDLAHLAPSTANVVDACMSLDETTPLFGEMLVGLMGSYGSLLPDDINSLDSTPSNATDSATSAATAAEAIKTTTTNTTATGKQNCTNNKNDNNINNDNKATETTPTTPRTSPVNGSNNSKVSATVAHIDPFINYREESNDTNCSQHLLSPSVTSTSPEASSLPSLCSPNSLSQEDEFAFMTMNVDDDIDLTMRAPYIPMNEQDDLPLLTADDLMWCSSNPFSSDDIQMQKDIADVMQQQFQQLQQIQATCENPHLRNNILDFNSIQQQQQQTHHQQHQQSHLNNNFSNSLCSSPTSTVSSLSPSPVGGNLQQQQQQETNNATSVFGSDSSELAALLCGTGNGTLTILSGSSGNNCNDENDVGNCNGLVGGTTDSNQCASNIVGGDNGGGGSCDALTAHHFRQHLLDEELQQRQQQQQMLGGFNIICKKEKFPSNALTAGLCDPIEDAFENVYSKDSSNLGCWNEFLPINASETTPTIATAQTQLDLDYQNENCEQHQQQQDLLLNAVPLITIQNNKNIILQQQLQPQQDIVPTGIIINNNKLIVNDEMLSAATATATANNRNNVKLATIKVINGATKHQQQQQRNQTVTKTTIIQKIVAPQQQQHLNGNKRHMNANSLQFGNKRLKCNNEGGAAGDEMQTTPQLLQQLIAPLRQQMPLTIKIESKAKQQQLQSNKPQPNQRWSNVEEEQKNKQQQQRSDSVLKNLLLSGCDDLETPEPSVTQTGPMVTDENSLDNGAPASPFSECSISPLKPLLCLTSTASVLRNFRHNPMIGGPGILPSPTLLPNEDSNTPPELINASDVAVEDDGDLSMSSDSGIGEAQTMMNVVPTVNDSIAVSKQQSKPVQIVENTNKNNVLLFLKVSDEKKSMLSQFTNDNIQRDDEHQQLRRKTSISFLDSSNPLLATPFLMDLCNDDYNMNAGELLQENDIESVLNQWTHELV